MPRKPKTPGQHYAGEIAKAMAPMNAALKRHSVRRLVRRIYCRYCGAKLRTDHVGFYCPTDNCQWRYGLPSDEPGALRSEKPTPAEVRKVKCRTKNKIFREALAVAQRPPNTEVTDAGPVTHKSKSADGSRRSRGLTG